MPKAAATAKKAAHCTKPKTVAAKILAKSRKTEYLIF
jgi:hypothetical protein